MKQKEEPITPAESLDNLPRLTFEPEKIDQEPDLRRTELLQSVLAIARVDHIVESQLVREVVNNALGHVPDIKD